MADEMYQDFVAHNSTASRALHCLHTLVVANMQAERLAEGVDQAVRRPRPWLRTEPSADVQVVDASGKRIYLSVRMAPSTDNGAPWHARGGPLWQQRVERHV